MKKNHLILTLTLLIVVLGGLLIFFKSKEQTPVSSNPPPSLERPPVVMPSQPGDRPQIIAAPLKKGSRPYYGSLPQGVSDIKKLPMANKPRKEWLPKLKNHLLKQGGERLADLKIIPEESYVIPDGNAGRYVERVVVRIKAKDGASTSFFAEVDSETGYVLKTWGATIHEKKRSRH